MKGKLLQKTTALMLVLCMTMVNFLFVATNIVYAVSSTEVSIESGNIVFDAYFKDEAGNKTYSKDANISEGATLYAKIKLKNGDLNGAVIKIDSANFKISEDIKSSYVAEVDSGKNEIKLKNLIGSYVKDDIELEIPVSFEKQSTINVDYFSKDNTITLSGDYNSETSKHVDATINTHLNWDENFKKTGLKAVNATNYTVEKAIKDGNKVVIQEGVVVSSKSLPRTQDRLDIEVPKINGNEPDTIDILINGNKVEENIKTKYYDIPSGTLKFTNSLLKDKVINYGTGSDTYKIIYVFNNIENPDELKNITRNIEVFKIYTTIFGYNETEKPMALPKEEDGPMTVNFNRGNIVSVKAKNSTNSVYKGFMYANSANGTKYNEKYEVEISNKESINKVELKLEKDGFYNGENLISDTNNQTKYTKLKFDWNNVSNILGANGTIKIVDDKNEIKEIKEDTEKEVELDTHNITITTSAPVNEGVLNIIAEKSIIGDAGLGKDKIQQINAIQTTVKVTTNKDEEGSTADVTTELKEPTTKPAKLTVTPEVLSTKNVNNVEFQVKLATGTPDTYLFKKPIVTLELPEDVAEISNVSAKALFAEKNELKVEQSNITIDGNKIIIPIEGEQTVFDNQTIGGIVVTVNAQVKVNANVEEGTELPVQKAAKVTMTYTNENAATQPEPATANVTIDIQKQETTQPTQEPTQPENPTTQEPTQPEEPVQGVEEKTDSLSVKMTAVSAGVELKDGDQINAGQTVTYTYFVENLTDKNIENVKLKVDHDGTAKIYEDVTEKDELEKDYTSEKLTDKTSKEFDLKTILPKAKSEAVVYQVRVNEDATQLNSKATITGNDIKKVEINQTNAVKQAELELELSTNIAKEYSAEKDIFSYDILKVTNKTEKLLENINVTIKVPQEFKIEKLEANTQGSEDFVISNQSTNSNTLTFKINKLAAKNNNQYKLVLNMQEANPTRANVEYNYSATVGENTYYSNTISVKLRNKPSSSVQLGQVANIKEDTVKTGDELIYTIALKNTGTDTDEFILTDNVPNAAVVQKVNYKIGDKETTATNIKNNTVIQTLVLKPEEVAVVTISTIIDEEKTGREQITNYATVVGNLLEEEVKTKEITHKLASNIRQEETEEPVDPTPTVDPENPQDPSTPSIPGTLTTKNSISGMAWVDANKNGVRESAEKPLTGISARLVNTKTNKFVTDEKGEKLEVTTNSNGAYTFENIEEGKYIVVFTYDTLKYRNTEYNASSATENTNSDIITGTISTDNNARTYAITNELVLKNKSLEHIDAGFIENEIFDLKLNKYISKVTIQNTAGTVVKQYNKEQLAKVEIDAKLLASSTVLVEYTLEITNEGELAGYANEIVDYMPKDMTFSSEINKSWYKSTDGNVHTTALSKEIIQPGETKQVVLTLTKAMTENNTGVTTNKAEIAKSSNELSIPDKDTADNTSSAELIVSIRTGVEFTIGIIIAIIAVTTTGIVVYTKKRKEASHE